MGNLVSASATVDGFPVYSSVQSIQAVVLSFVSAVFWPVTSILEMYRPPISLRLERAAKDIEPAERRKLIETLEEDREVVSSALTKISENVATLRAREVDLDTRLVELEGLQRGHSIALARYEESPSLVASDEDAKKLETIRQQLDSLPAIIDAAHRNLIGMRAERLTVEQRLKSLDARRSELTANIDALKDVDEAEEDVVLGNSEAEADGGSVKSEE